MSFLWIFLIFGDEPIARWQLLKPPGGGWASEVSVVIDPTNPDHTLMAALGASPEMTSRISNVIYRSENFGGAFQASLAENPDQRVQGDDALAVGHDGTFYHSYISFTGLRNPRSERFNNGIFVRKSKDGKTWGAPVVVVDHLNTLEPFEDKPYLVVDRALKSPYLGTVHITWTRFDAYGSEDPTCKTHIFYSGSGPDELKFSHPIRISDHAGNCLDSDQTVEGAVPATGLNGEVYVVWAGEKGLWFDRSTDGGTSFGEDKLISKMPGGWDQPVKELERHNGMPVTAVDLSSGPHSGSLYVNWIDERNGEPDVFVMASRDGGETFEEPVKVNTDEGENLQMFTWMDVDPTNGNVAIVFHDRRGLKDGMTQVVLAYSTDGGKSFSNQILPIPAFKFGQGGFLGDYNGIAAYDNRIAIAAPRWGENGIELWGYWATSYKLQAASDKP